MANESSAQDYRFEAGNLIITFDGQNGKIISDYDSPYEEIQVWFVKEEIEDLLEAFKRLYQKTKVKKLTKQPTQIASKPPGPDLTPEILESLASQMDAIFKNVKKLSEQIVADRQTVHTGEMLGCIGDIRDAAFHTKRVLVNRP